MKKALLVVLVIVQLLIFCIPSMAISTDPSDYENYYPQFVDSKLPLSTLSERDIATWTYKPLSALLDKNMIGWYNVPYGTDPAQKLDIYNSTNTKKQPVIFYIHGGGWATGDKDDVGALAIAGKEWLSKGYMVVSINYRLGVISKDDPTAAKRIPSQPVVDTIDPATRNAYPTQIEDCDRALKWVIDNISKYGGDPDNIAITGISAGGHLAALLTVDNIRLKSFGIDRSKIKCSIPVAGIYDCTLPENYSQEWMPAFMKAMLDIPEKAIDASPVVHVTGNEPPMLIVHGSDDWLVPRTNAYEMFDVLKEKGSKTAELEILRGYNHGTTLTRYNEPGDDAAKVINRFLAVYLPSDGNHVDGKKLDVDIRLNDSTVDFDDAQPYIQNGIIMVPETFITKNISAWMQLDSPGIYKVTLGNVSVKVDDSMLAKKDKTTFVPLRFVCEGLGAKVEWLPNTQTAVVDFN